MTDNFADMVEKRSLMVTEINNNISKRIIIDLLEASDE